MPGQAEDFPWAQLHLQALRHLSQSNPKPFAPGWSRVLATQLSPWTDTCSDPISSDLA